MQWGDCLLVLEKQTKPKLDNDIKNKSPMNLTQILLALAASITQSHQLIAAAVRTAFDGLPRLAPRRVYGRATKVEREAFRFFFKNGISREEIAVKFAVSFQTVYHYTRNAR